MHVTLAKKGHWIPAVLVDKSLQQYITLILYWFMSQFIGEQACYPPP